MTSFVSHKLLGFLRNLTLLPLRMLVLHFLEGSTDISGDIGSVEVGMDSEITAEESSALCAKAREVVISLETSLCRGL